MRCYFSNKLYGLGVKGLGSGFRVYNLWFRVYDCRFSVQGFGSRVYGMVRFQGVWFRVYGSQMCVMIILCNVYMLGDAALH